MKITKNRLTALLAPSGRFYWLLHALVAVSLIGVIVYAKWLDVPAQIRGLKVAVAALAAAVLALQGAAILYARARSEGRRRLTPAVVLVLAAAVAATGMAATYVRPLSAAVRLQPYYARVSPDALHVAMGYAAPGLGYYSDTLWRFDRGPTRAEIASPGIFLYRGAEFGLHRLFAPRAGNTRRTAVAACGTVANVVNSTVPASRATVDERARRAGVPAFVIDSDLSRAVVCGFNFARSTWTELVVFYRESTPPPQDPR